MSADANRTGLLAVEEIEWGVVPAATDPQILRITGESLKYAKTTAQSAIIRSDRQKEKSTLTGFSVSGGYNFEFGFGEIDTFLEGTMFDTWTTPIETTGTDIAASAAGGTDGKPALTSSTTDFTTNTDFTVGRRIRISGFTDVNANQIVRIEDVAANLITITVDDQSITFPTEAAGNSITLTPSYRLVNGADDYHSYAIERQHLDVSQFFTYLGCMVNTFSLSFAKESMITGSFDFLGKGLPLDLNGKPQITQVTGLDGTEIPALSTPTMNTVTDVSRILITDNAPAACLIESFDLSLANNLRARTSIGQAGACGIGIGEIGLTGSMSVYFKNEEYYNQYLKHQTLGLEFVCSDENKNIYVFEIPALTIDDDSVNTGGSNQDVMESLSWSAFKHPTKNITFAIQRLAAA